MRELRASGRYGPRLREVLPALAVLVLAVAAATAALAPADRAVGPWVPAPVLVTLTVVAVVALRRSRRPARRRHGYYTAQELADLDPSALVLAVARMLRRDGWRVLRRPPTTPSTSPPVTGAGGCSTLAFRPVAEPLPDEDDACSCRARWRSGRPVRLVVHRGTLSHRDEVWTARRHHTHLLDGARLLLWAGGTPLAEITALGSPPRSRRP
ncbi:hypothetical protein ABZ137_12305 [Streptomyces bobili]|uniref:hypothetical protein n=1 Tax=Streptomyces bobili TaxID=67280 RepID=UPI0033AA570E